MRSGLNRARFSLRQVFLWLSIYALLLGSLSCLPVTPNQFLAAVAVVTAFVIIDSQSKFDRGSAPTFARVSLAIAFYATAFAAATAVSFAIYEYFPPTPTPKPPLPLLAFLLELGSGHLFHEIGNAVGDALAVAITHYALFAACSAAAFFASLFALRHFRFAKWLAIVNAPGAFWGGFVVAAGIYDSIVETAA